MWELVKIQKDNCHPPRPIFQMMRAGWGCPLGHAGFANPRPLASPMATEWCSISSPADFYLLRLKHRNLFSLSSARPRLAG